METKHSRPITSPGHGLTIWKPPLLLLLLLLRTPRCAEAQSSTPSSDTYGFRTANFSPVMAIVIVILISVFFLFGFFSLYIRNCGGNRTVSASVRGFVVRGSRRGAQRGLDPAVIATFPTLVYSAVKGLKVGKGTLECAVCLSEFEDDETLRLLPRCSHVFHTDCIDVWLASHVTCPVCRSNLVPDDSSGSVTADPVTALGPESEQEPPGEQHPIPPEQVVIAVEEEMDDDRKLEMIELARIASLKRTTRSRSVRMDRFSRSHSTGHSVFRPGEDCDRFTLQLPEHVRKEIIAAGKLQRTASCVAFPTGGEGSSRRGYRGGGGEGTSCAGRSIRLGRSGRWAAPAFLRTLSARIPSWRRGEWEGSVKKGEAEGSNRGTFRAPFDCLGGGGKPDVGGGDDESSDSPLARV